MDTYLLPSHPQLTCLDPLSVTDSDNPTSWQVIVAHITLFKASQNNTLNHLPTLIEDLAYSLHGNGALDTSFLRNFLATAYQDTDLVAKHVLDNIILCALSLPAIFPSHHIHHLSGDKPIRTMNTSQIRSLVAHQLLGTLRPPQGNNWGTNLSCWYSSPQPLENAVRGYLTTLFQYFVERGDLSIFVRYEFCSILPSDVSYGSLQGCRNLAFSNLVLEATDVDSVPFPHGTIDCMVVSSNAYPGFGNACTQEELATAACPELLPLGAILISPPIPGAAAIFAHNVTPISYWTGQGRNARLIGVQKERQCSVLLIDAAELDLESATFPDLDPAILKRDLIKLLVGFAALQQHGISDVASPLWGAGSFGGDPVVKAIILSLAAAFIGVKVHLSVDEKRLSQVAGGRQKPGSSDITVLYTLQLIQYKCQSMTVHEALCLLGAARASQCCDGWGVATTFIEAATGADNTHR